VHKFNCSALSSPSVTALPRDEVRRAVEALSSALNTWCEAARAAKTDGLAIAALPATRVWAGTSSSHSDTPSLTHSAEGLRAHISPALALARTLKDAAKFPFRTPIAALTRLFLVDALADMSAAEQHQIAAGVEELQYPSHMAAIYGPKVVARPADLSPGEYETIAQLLPMVLMEVYMAKSGGGGEMDRWMNLSTVYRTLWSAPDE
jgi:hypothetical protein